MPIEFDITLDVKDMYRFNLYQTYSGFQGILSIVTAIAVWVLAAVTRGEVEPMYTALYACFGVVFLLYLPGTLYLRSKAALAKSGVLSRPLHYRVDKDGFTVSQAEESANLPWKQIYKMVATKNNVLVYSSRINAYVIPRKQLGAQYEPLARIANDRLEKFRVKMK